jgi:hypothetical protein
MSRALVATVVAAGTLAAASPAVAADLTVQGTCFASGQELTVTGTAFTPGATVTLAGDATGTAVADATGAFTTTTTAPAVSGLEPQSVTVAAVDGANPANRATLRVSIVAAGFSSNFPVAGNPRARVRWRFVGFVPGRPVYAHLLLDGRLRGHHRFGVARGDCGTLTAHARRVPGVDRLTPGRWTLRVDQRRRYRPGTRGAIVRFRIRRAAS